jgi:hypothetical protein
VSWFGESKIRDPHAKLAAARILREFERFRCDLFSGEARTAGPDPIRTFSSNLGDNFEIPLLFGVWRHFPPSVNFYIIYRR